MHWAGTPSGRVGRGSSAAPVCETRWIVPVTPYKAPRGSMESVENQVLIGAGVAVIIFGFALMVMSAMC